MAKHPLGLPLEYSKLSQYFDALSQDHDDSKNQIIEKILRNHHVKTVLDLTCGTGSQTIWLAKRGYKVTGADMSPALLEIAKTKAHAQHLEIPLFQGDMRALKIGFFDAVITIFNAIGHLTHSGFEKALQNISHNLQEGGVYIFDILNLEAMTDQKVAQLSVDITKQVHDTQIRHIQYSSLNRTLGRLTSYDQFIIQKSGESKTIKGKFTLQIYSAEELGKILNQQGFKILSQYGIDGAPFLAKETESILTIAQKNK